MEQAGVQLIAAGGDVYISTMDKATNVTNTFVDATDKGSGKVSGAGQVMIGALREVGKIAVTALAQAAKATAAFVGDSIGLAGDFEQGMLNFQAVAGKDVDTKGLDQFKDLFLSLGKELPVSTSEVQQAAIEMIKGGIDPAIVAAGGLKQNIQFAAAAMEGDLVAAAEVSSKILGGWADSNATAQQKAEFLTHATDQLTKAANASSVDVHELSLGIFNAQGIAKTAGVSFDDLTTTLAALSPRFASSSEAGNSLKNVIARLQPQTKTAAGFMLDLGLITEEGGNKFYDAEGKFVGFQKASEILKTSLVGLTDQQKTLYLQQIFGNDAMNAAAGLADLGAEGYQHMADALDKANGVQENAALKQQGFNTALDNAKGSVEALQITLGSALLPVLTDLLNNVVAPAVNTLTDMSDAVFGNDDAFNRLSPTLQGIVEEVKRLSDAFSKGGLSGLIDQVTTDITAAIPDIEAALQDWGQAFIDWIAPMIPPVLNALGDLVDKALAWVIDQAPEWGKQLLVWGDEFIQWIAPMIPPFLVELGKLGMQFIGWIGDQAAPLLKKFNDWAASLVEWIPGATVTFLAEWPEMLDKFLDWVGESAGPLLKQLGDWALSFIQWIAPMIPPFLVALGGVALAIGTFVIETAAVLSKKIVEVWVPAILTWIVTDAIPGLVKALNEFLKVFQGWIEDAQRDLARWMVDVGTSIVDGIKEGISSAWNTFTGWIHDKIMEIPEVVRTALGISSPSKEFAAIGVFAVQGLMQGFSETWPQLTDLVGGLSDKLIGQMQDIGSQMQDVIADSFGATASIDRQMAKNLDAIGDIQDEFTRKIVAQDLEALKKKAMDLFPDPKVAADYYKMVSNHEFETLKLRQQIAEASTQEEKDRLNQQLILISRAQEAELSQFYAAHQGEQSPAQQFVEQINDIMKALAGINLTEDQLKIVDMLSSVWYALQNVPHRAQGGAVDAGQPYWVGEKGPELFWPQTNGMVSPAASSAQLARAANTTNYNGQVGNTYHMPIYTNNSPAAIQQSWAVLQASMP